MDGAHTPALGGGGGSAEGKEEEQEIRTCRHTETPTHAIEDGPRESGCDPSGVGSQGSVMADEDEESRLLIENLNCAAHNRWAYEMHTQRYGGQLHDTEYRGEIDWARAAAELPEEALCWCERRPPQAVLDVPLYTEREFASAHGAQAGALVWSSPHLACGRDA
eukprot:gene13070-21653_t